MMNAEHFKKLFLDMMNNTTLNELEAKLNRRAKGDTIDLAVEERDRSLYFKLRGREDLYLKKIQEAIGRIEDGSFGECLDCGSDIEQHRLYARPTATHCICCKEEQERGERQLLYAKRSHTLGRKLINPAAEQNLVLSLSS
jgi:DnaK suppressor protein